MPLVGGFADLEVALREAEEAAQGGIWLQQRVQALVSGWIENWMLFTHVCEAQCAVCLVHLSRSSEPSARHCGVPLYVHVVSFLPFSVPTLSFFPVFPDDHVLPLLTPPPPPP